MDMLSVSLLIHHNTLIQNRPAFRCFEWFLRSTFPQDQSLTSNKGFHVYVPHANAGEAHCFKVLDNVYHFSICSSDLMRPSGKYLPKLPKSIKIETPHMYHMTWEMFSLHCLGFVSLLDFSSWTLFTVRQGVKMHMAWVARDWWDY